MKTVFPSPSHVKRSKLITVEGNLSDSKEERDSYYFPGCRKDANCNCEICLDSLNATLDLMPKSIQRRSLTKLSASKPAIEKTFVSIDPTLLSTPISRTTPIQVASSSALRSTAKMVYNQTNETKKRKFGFGLKFYMWVLLLGLIIGLQLPISWGILGVLRPTLSGEILRDLVKDSSDAKNLSERLIMIQKGLEGSVDGKVSSCNHGDSTWRINQDGLILISYCILYGTAAEEVILWGWPLQTAGLLTAGFSSRSFTVLSGKVTEWPEGKIVYVIREANSTWVLRKWSSSVVEFNPNTWIIEYKQSMFLENPNVFLAATEFIKFRAMRIIKQQLWHLLDVRHYTASISEAGLSIPT